MGLLRRKQKFSAGDRVKGRHSGAHGTVIEIEGCLHVKYDHKDKHGHDIVDYSDLSGFKLLPMPKEDS